MPTITLDVVFGTDGDETIEEALTDLINGLPITYVIVNLNGPGGGWPVITFTGERPYLLALIERYDDDQLSFFASRIEG